MSDDQRIYSDEDFALILRKAAELASQAEAPAFSSAGLTLTEMKAAAAQVGFDPGLVERAARLMAAGATESPLERLIGGPLRHDQEARFPSSSTRTGPLGFCRPFASTRASPAAGMPDIPARWA